jgi:hypothetical protein
LTWYALATGKRRVPDLSGMHFEMEQTSANRLERAPTNVAG